MYELGDTVDPFIGTEAIDLPEPEGVAATWFYLKAQIGNNHPGAALPNSPVTALPYSGGYPTGYGVYDVNSHGVPPKLYEKKCAYGVTHIHHNGTGFVRFFYNYLLVIPFIGRSPVIPDIDLSLCEPHPLERERAHPGYYAGFFSDTGIELELTVGTHAAAHRYRFPSTSDRGIVVDATNGGLRPKRAQYRPECAVIHACGNGEVVGEFVFHGVRWFFAVCCPGASDPVLWKSGGGVLERPEEARSVELAAQECRQLRAGALFRGSRTMEVYVGFSVSGTEQALGYAREAGTTGFDALLARARRKWENCFERIRVTGGSERERRLFYTSMYHSLLKPVKSEPDNFLWRGGPDLYADFATMWDQYKTQIPLLFTLFPEHILPIVRSLKATADTTDEYPAALLFARDSGAFSGQSRLLPFVVIRDAFDRIYPAGMRDPQLKRGQESREWKEILDSMVRVLPKAASEIRPAEEINGYSHLLDISCAAHCAYGIARRLGMSDQLDGVLRYIGLRHDAFDESTGMMKPGTYYEADNQHYSFRLLHSMRERIEIAGGATGFSHMLDRFFGYDARSVRQLGAPPCKEERARGMALGRFDGLNNEVMLETPYAYHYVGRPDRTAEVVHGILRYHFDDGAGGISGNDDSGALSAWYVWSAIGLYPVPGQGTYLLGSPLFDEVCITTGDGTFVVSAEQIGDGNRDGNRCSPAYLTSIRLNAKSIERSYIRYDEITASGRLDIGLGDDPNAFKPMEFPPGGSKNE